MLSYRHLLLIMMVMLWGGQGRSTSLYCASQILPLTLLRYWLCYAGLEPNPQYLRGMPAMLFKIAVPYLPARKRHLT